MSVDPISLISPVVAAHAEVNSALAAGHSVDERSFSQMLLQGVGATDAKLAEIDRLVTAFALDDTIPVHQVTYALEQARLSFELMIQLRNRLLDAYQQMMSMQL